MYEYLTGTISIVAPQYIVVDVQGVGYKLLVANPYRFHEDSAKAVRVFVYQAVRDDDISLFGFSDRAEKRLFMQLINVSGIGPANPALADALAALKALGYKEREVKKIGKQLGEEQQSTDEYLRQALRLLNQ